MLTLRNGGLTPDDVLGSKELYAAVLTDAIHVLEVPRQHLGLHLRKKVQEPTMHEQLLLAQVSNERRWVLSDSVREPFSFVRCCQAMNLDPDAVRDALRRKGLLDSAEKLISAGNARKRGALRRRQVRRAAVA